MNIVLHGARLGVTFATSGTGPVWVILHKRDSTQTEQGKFFEEGLCVLYNIRATQMQLKTGLKIFFFFGIFNKNDAES